MNAAVTMCCMRVGASLKSSAVRHGFPAIRPLTGTSSGQGPERCATADSRAMRANTTSNSGIGANSGSVVPADIDRNCRSATGANGTVGY
jgi:hypothetical protein